MADIRSPVDDGLSSEYGRRTGSFERPPPSASGPPDATPLGHQPNAPSFGAPSELFSPSTASATTTQAPATLGAVGPEIRKQVDGVLKSEIGISTLLNRLKSSIASAREFGLFLRKRANLEEDNAQSLRKVCRLTQDNLRRPDHRQGTFSKAYDELFHINDRMADNSSTFAASLLTMHDDLIDLATATERSRKHWKATGLSAEQKVTDLELTMRKSKIKYDSLADEYERARTGEGRGTGKVLNAFKNKSAAQVEEDLLRKVQAADQTYHGHVQTLQTEKSHLETSLRPEAIKALTDHIQEMDAGLTLQMQKLAAFNEKLLLSNGLCISPIKGPGADLTPMSRSLRAAVSSVDNEKDLNDYISAYYPKVPQRPADIKYERHPVLAPQASQQAHHPPPGPPPSGALNQHPPQISGQIPVQTQGGPASHRNEMGNFGPPGNFQGPPPGGPPGFSPGGGHSPSQPFAQPHNRSFSQGNMQQPFSPQNASQPAPPYSTSSPSSNAPPQLGALSFQNPQSPSGPPPPPQKNQPSHERQASAPLGVVAGVGGNRSSPPQYSQPTSAPPKPMFGVHLSRLYERDGLAVPSVVYQCIQAVDLFGLGVEGIYRQSGSLTHINKLKHMFDIDSQSPALDFRNPENFYHDVNSVTGLLKQFCRDLPDPLLTWEHHDSLVAAGKHDDDTVRRDSLHAIINNLPDPNYATLRAICLHLTRVVDSAHVNRMNSHNLAVIFGPTLMGTDPAKAIADAGWQIKVIDTIIQNTYQIFDED